MAVVGFPHAWPQAAAIEVAFADASFGREIPGVNSFEQIAMPRGRLLCAA